MVLSKNRWRLLFLFCLGLAMAAAFCMKWMEPDFIVDGEKFGIMGLELFYPLEKVETILKGLDASVSTALYYHLHFDFAFMVGIFPGIAALCMMAKEMTKKKGLRTLLGVLAIFQLLAWAFDIAENIFLLGWMKNPQINETDFFVFHLMVSAKWIIALLGVFIATPFFVVKRKSEAL
jgi:hypothetical protein